MQNDICLSIIIPVYNSGRYLERCIDSILRTNSIGKAEILIIDDGSEDDSGRIADGYAKAYSNITVFHKENSGPSDSRNFGLFKAIGKYVFFCDSDDEVVPDKLSDVISLIERIDADVVLWDSRLIDEDDKPLNRPDNEDYIHKCLSSTSGIITGRQYQEKQFAVKSNYPATVWCGVYLRDYLINNDMFFVKEIIHEDELWVTKVLTGVTSVKYLPETVYCYRIRKGSITNPLTSDRTKHIESLLYIYPELYKHCEEKFSGDPILRLIEGKLTQRYLYMIFKYDFHRSGYGKLIDKKKLWKTSIRIKDKCKVILLMLKG